MVVCTLAALLASCSPADRTADDGVAATATATAGAVAPAPSPAATVAPSATAADRAICTDGVCVSPDATYATVDVDRELTPVEQALMRAPGRYAGDAFDEQAAWDAVRDADPATARQWSEAILEQVHADYADDARDVITFAATIEGVPDEPVEQVRGVDVVGRNHFAIVLDASGSMADRSQGPTRMSQAKDAIRDFASELPDDATVSLRIYGHEGSNRDADKARSCRSSTVVHQGAPDGVARSLRRVRPVGWTPLARAVRASAGDIPEDASDAIVYIVTDGLETCGGDPVRATRGLASQDIEPIVNVIGFELGDADTRQLRRMARVGGGTYTDARSQADLEAFWREDLRAMMVAWNDWKRDALDTINREGRQNMDEAQASGRAVMDATGVEWDHAQQLIRRMESSDVEYAVRSAVWNELYERRRALWGWAYRRKNENWSDAYAQKRQLWSEAYARGGSKWSEYYARTRR